MLTHLTAGMLLRRSLPRASGHTSRGVLTPAPLKPTKCTQRLVANTRVTRYGRPAAALYICNRYQLTCTFLPRCDLIKVCHTLSQTSPGFIAYLTENTRSIWRECLGHGGGVPQALLLADGRIYIATQRKLIALQMLLQFLQDVTISCSLSTDIATSFLWYMFCTNPQHSSFKRIGKTRSKTTQSANKRVRLDFHQHKIITNVTVEKR